MALTNFELRSRLSVGSFLGFVQGISLPTVLQMVEMERTTCTICVHHEDGSGRLHFRDGQLIDADAGPLTGETAAFDILTWPSNDIEIRTFAGDRRQRIRTSLPKILIEASRRLDEDRRDGKRLYPREVPLVDVADDEPEETVLLPTELTASFEARLEQEIGMNSLHKLLESFRQEVPEFISTDIVNIESGLSIGGGSTDPDFDASVAAASYAEVVKANSRALELLGLGGSTTEDILISTERVYILIRPMGVDYYQVLAVGRRGNLGLARAIMKKYEPKLLAAIGELS